HAPTKCLHCRVSVSFPHCRHVDDDVGLRTKQVFGKLKNNRIRTIRRKDVADGFGQQPRLRAASMVDGDFVTTGYQLTGKMRADELRPTDDDDPHPYTVPRRSVQTKTEGSAVRLREAQMPGGRLPGDCVLQIELHRPAATDCEMRNVNRQRVGCSRHRNVRKETT